MNLIDLESDTVTLPTAAMRRAMAEAEVGDDVMGEDPTVNRLEEMAAAKLGKEAALFTASGTMSNLVSILTHCQRGEEIIVGSEAHIFHYEVGGSASLAGVHTRLVPNDPQGRLPSDLFRRAIRPGGDIHLPRTALICLENTHTRCGGTVLTPDDLREAWEIAKSHGIPVYLDGARIFNASVYLGIDVKELTRYADAVSFCLSKGLSAPVGAVLCGTKDFVSRARKYRKMVGGGMRQVGVIAAAGIVALEQMIDRLAEDHQNAKLLAEGLAELPGIQVDVEATQTNAVMASLQTISAEDLCARLMAEGVRVAFIDPDRVRLMTHYGISEDDVKQVLVKVGQVLADK